MLHHFETMAMSRLEDDGGLPSNDLLDQHLAADDVAMLALGALAAVGAAVLLMLGF